MELHTKIITIINYHDNVQSLPSTVHSFPVDTWRWLWGNQAPGRESEL